MPATYELFRRWVPGSERSRAVTRFLSGIPLGQIIGFIVTGWLTARFGWSASFYLFGLIGFVWTALWLAHISNDPRDDKHISAQELELLQDGSAIEQVPPGTSVRKLLTRSPVWAVFIAHFCNNWGLYLLIAWLPSYFRDSMGLSFANAGLYAAAPWLAAFAVGNVVAAIADKAIAGGVALVLVRKLIVGVGLLGFACCLLLVRDAHSSTSALLLVCLATGSLGICWSGFAPNMLDIAPRHCAVLIGVSNTLATIPGVAGVAITGWLLDRTGSYSTTFTLTAAIALLGALVYFVFGSAEQMDK
jgi:MFS transporter, ACS family, solute carrier family 17 (sodium-dependent inorganic phosphate cotransporter), other